MRCCKTFFLLIALLVPVTFAGCGASVDNSPPPTAAELEKEAEVAAEEEAAEEAVAATQRSGDASEAEEE